MDDALLLGYLHAGKASQERLQEDPLGGWAKLPQVLNNQFQQILRASFEVDGHNGFLIPNLSSPWQRSLGTRPGLLIVVYDPVFHGFTNPHTCHAHDALPTLHL